MIPICGPLFESALMQATLTQNLFSSVFNYLNFPLPHFDILHFSELGIFHVCLFFFFFCTDMWQHWRMDCEKSKLRASMDLASFRALITQTCFHFQQPGRWVKWMIPVEGSFPSSFSNVSSGPARTMFFFYHFYYIYWKNICPYINCYHWKGEEK